MPLGKKILLAMMLSGSTTLFAHGEDAPGPHNGFVRMPGAYHVETIPTKDALDIMLLDVNFKNPTVLNSNIKVSIKSGKQVYHLSCESMENYFTCPVSTKLLNRGTLVIESVRQQSEGIPVEYPLPLHVENINV